MVKVLKAHKYLKHLLVKIGSKLLNFRTVQFEIENIDDLYFP